MTPNHVTCPCCGMTFNKNDFSGDNWKAFCCRVHSGLNGSRLLGKFRQIHVMIAKKINSPGFDTATELRRLLKEIKIERIENFK